MKEKIIITVNIINVKVLKIYLNRWINGLFTLWMFIIANGFLFITSLILKLLYFQFSFKQMSKQITVKYFQASVFAKEPVKATEGAAGYDLYAAEAKTIVPGKSRTVWLDLRWAIPTGFFGKIFPRSSLIKDHNVTVDAGLIDSDWRGLIYVLFVNNSEEAFTIPTGNRVAQVLSLEKFNVDFVKVNKKEKLGSTKRGSGGFGSTGATVTKKMKPNEELTES